MTVLFHFHLSLLLSLIFLLYLPLPVHAFRCGDGLVSVGDSKGKVLIECGKPPGRRWRIGKPAARARKKPAPNDQERGAMDV